MVKIRDSDTSCFEHNSAFTTRSETHRYCPKVVPPTINAEVKTMDLSRYYFITDDLDDLESLESELLAAGITTPQTHVLSRTNADVNSHHNLNSVSSFMKRDVVHSSILGAIAGLSAASLILVVSFFAGWTNSAAGWLPFVLLALTLMFFFTWMGGFWGIQMPNHHFRRFHKVLDQGKHVFFIDFSGSQKDLIMKITDAHPKLMFAGKGEPVPSWVVALESKTDHWWYWRMWRNA